MSENLENLKQKASQLLNDKNWDELIPVCTRIIELEKSPSVKAFAYFYRGYIHYKKGNLDLAIADFNKVLKLKPIDTVKGMAHLLRAFVYLLKRDFLKALDDFVDSNKYGPSLKFSSSLNYVALQIANIYKRSKEKDKAEAFELYLMLLISIDNIKEKQFYKPEEGREVAHYTSLHTLKDLANKERFRFYNAAYMNDPEEGSVLFDIIKEKEPGIKVKEVFYEEDGDPPYPSPAYIGSFIMVDLDNQEQKDELFLWRTYGKHSGQEAAGACLIFRHEGTCFAKSYEPSVGNMQQLQPELPMVTGDLKNPEENQHSKPALYEILYMDEETKKELSKELNELVEALKDVNSMYLKKEATEKID